LNFHWLSMRSKSIGPEKFKMVAKPEIGLIVSMYSAPKGFGYSLQPLQAALASGIHDIALGVKQSRKTT